VTSQWCETTLGAICDRVDGIIQTGPFGSQLHESDYSQEGTPVVMPKDIIEGRIITDSVARIASEHVERLSRHKLKPGDIVYGRRGDIGRQALIRKEQDGWLCGTGCLRLSLSATVIEPLFLHYYLRQESVISWISNQAVGATLPNLNTGILRSVPVRVPPLPVQRRIAGILSAYDELIENNQRRIKILEEMARSLYREWFVHFRFPGHENHPCVASSLGEIPKGWDIASFEQAAVFENGDRGKNYPSVSEFVDDGVPFINAGHLVDGGVDLSHVNRISEVKFEQLRSGKIREGDLLYCLRGSPGRTARTAGISCGAIASSLVIIRPTDRTNTQFLYYTLSGESGSRMVSELNNGVAQPNISVGSVQKYPLLLPSNAVLIKFARFIEPGWGLIDALRAQLSALKAQRDLLLPRLLSGQINLNSTDAIA
jgi:type I restriction enzyme, S subunit